MGMKLRSVGTISRHGGAGLMGLDLGATAIRATVLSPGTGRAPQTGRHQGGAHTAHSEQFGHRGAAGRPQVRQGPSGEFEAHGVTVRHTFSEPLPVGAVFRGSVREPELVTATVRRLIARHRLHGYQVVVGVNTPQIVVRPMSLPLMSADKMRQALPFQARSVIPFPVSDAVLDFSPLPHSTADGDPAQAGEPMAGLLTAAPREPVVAAVRAVEGAGLRVSRVDLSSFGILRAIGTRGSAVEAIVDIGSELTTIVIHRHGVPQVVRVIVFGGGRLTSRLSDAFGVPEAEAEMMKRSIGVIGDSAPAIQCRDETRPLFAEIQSSLRYFVTTVGSAVDRVLLTGGTAALPGLAGMCAATWAVPVEVVAPLRHVGESRGSVARNAASGDDAGSASAVSVGLALGAPVGR